MIFGEKRVGCRVAFELYRLYCTFSSAFQMSVVIFYPNSSYAYTLAVDFFSSLVGHQYDDSWQTLYN